MESVVTFQFKVPISSYYTTTKAKIDATSPTLSERQQSILRIIEHHGSTNVQTLLLELKNPPSQRTVQKELRYLKETGMVISMGLGKNIIWAIKHDQ